MNLKAWFGHKEPEAQGNGLYATLDELMAMRKLMRYVRNFRQKKAFSCQAGDIKSAFKGRGVELEEIRAYNFGDDVRDIDWRVSARKQQPYTKLFVEERDLEIYVWLDLSASMLFGTQKELKSVTASKLAALIGWLCLEKKDRFGCMIFDGRKTYWFKPQNNRAQLMAILKKMAALSQEVLQNADYDAAELGKSFKLLEQNAKNRASVFVISDFAHDFEQIRPELGILAKRNLLYLIDVFDVLEETPPKAGEYLAQYGDKRLIFDSAAKEYRHQYTSYFAQKRQKLADFCRQNGCSRVDFRTDFEIRNNLKFF